MILQRNAQGCLRRWAWGSTPPYANPQERQKTLFRHHMQTLLRTGRHAQQIQVFLQLGKAAASLGLISGL